MGDALSLDVGNRYSIVAMIFFVAYAVIDIPSTIIMKKVGASVMVPSVCLGFGVITVAQGFIHDWGSLAALRAILGLFEGALLPGTLFRKYIRDVVLSMLTRVKCFKSGILASNFTRDKQRITLLESLRVVCLVSSLME